MQKIPEFIYGTAWKEQRTAELTLQAVKAGFRAIDTANQKKHYREDFVGDALLEIAKLGIRREDLFLQTKYTYQRGQDHRLPYNPSDDFATQVKSSFESSLKHLHTDYLDSFLLHGPSEGSGLGDADWEVWEAIEALHKSGKAKMIGVSNFNIEQLETLVEKAEVAPMFVQNRCYSEMGWDKQVREFCKAKNVTYQGFSLLTANRFLWTDTRIGSIATRHQKTPQQILFRFAKQIGMLPITGTSSLQHAKEDLEILKFELSPTEMAVIETAGLT